MHVDFRKGRDLPAQAHIHIDISHIVCCGTYMQARFDVDAKRTKLAKLRGTAGIKVSRPLTW